MFDGCLASDRTGRGEDWPCPVLVQLAGRLAARQKAIENCVRVVQLCEELIFSRCSPS